MLNNNSNSMNNTENTGDYFKSFIDTANWIYKRLGDYSNSNNKNPRLFIESTKQTSKLLNVKPSTLLIAQVTNPLLAFCELAQDLDSSLDNDVTASELNSKELESSLLEFSYYLFLLLKYLSDRSVLKIDPSSNMSSTATRNQSTISTKSNPFTEGIKSNLDARIPSNS